VEIVIYVAFAANFFYNYSKNKAIRVLAAVEERRSGGSTPEKEGRADAEGPVPGGTRTALPLGTRLVIAGLVLSTTCLFIRAIYRTIEVRGGYSKSSGPVTIANSLVSSRTVGQVVSFIRKYISVRSPCVPLLWF
jgi:hypothetical protein